jgi:hypothetical protein
LLEKRLLCYFQTAGDLSKLFSVGSLEKIPSKKCV